MKSHVSTLTEVAICIYKDAVAKCSTIQSAKRDIQTIVSRVKDEGMSFLTITLPSFAADFEKSLAAGVIDPKYFRSFRKYRRIPAFLRDIVGLVFDADTGRIHDEFSVQAVASVRQIGRTFNKLKLPCSIQRTGDAYEQFITDERDLCEVIQATDASYFDSVSRCCWDWLFSARNLSSDMALPQQGPGATADRVVGNSKYRFKRWHTRLEPFFPLDSYAFVNTNAFESKEFEDLVMVSEDEEQPSRLIDVPKTQKSPRLIAIEPVCMQYTQQALSKALVRELERHKLTAGHVNFTDQSINQRLAFQASSDGRMATLDLSSASDRVPLSLVERMLRFAPDFLDAIKACRTKRVELRNGKIIPLLKFASMGSALCFPIESMYFYTICVGALLESRNLPVTYENVFKVSRDVYVYGDDIIVPVNDVDVVITHLQKYYCKVNSKKSFWTGKFRESCGMDACSGHSVTPTYVRTLPPNGKRDHKTLISWVKTARLFDENADYLTADFMYKEVERYLGKLPYVGGESSCLGRALTRHTYSIERYNRRLFQPEVSGWVASPVYRRDVIEGYPALLKCLLSLERGNATNDGKHLSRSARHGAATLKRRWVRPF